MYSFKKKKKNLNSISEIKYNYYQLIHYQKLKKLENKKNLNDYNKKKLDLEKLFINKKELKLQMYGKKANNLKKRVQNQLL